MPSKQKGKDKPAAETRAATLPRMSNKTKRFQKDWDRLSRSGRFNMADLKSVMITLIANDAALPPERKDHQLSGKEWQDCRECHVHGDFLLVYRLSEKDEVITFIAIGTHAELFD